MNEIIDFAVFLTGHDEETVRQMYADWAKTRVTQKPDSPEKKLCVRCEKPTDYVDDDGLCSDCWVDIHGM